MINQELNCEAVYSRREARQVALQLLYAVELSENPTRSTVDTFLKTCQCEEKLSSFILKLVELTVDHRDEYNDVVRKFSANWEFSRIALIDLIIMRMAICEFLHFYEIPPKVTIDESIELAKLFSTTKSGGYINGMLDSVLLDMKKRKQLVKSGRGMQEARHSQKEKNNDTL